MSRPKSKRQTVKRLITEGLGYCCEWAFFKLFHHYTGLIASRLGVDERTVRYHKAAFKAGQMRCQGCRKCLKLQIGTKQK